MPRPRILIFSTAYLPHIGGSELAIQHIAEYLTDFDIDLVTGKLDTSDAPMEQIGRVRVFRAGGRWARFTLVLPKLLMPLVMALTALRLTQRHHYRVFHAYQASQAAVAACLVQALNRSVPLVVTLQEGKELQRQSWLTRSIRQFVIRRANVLTAISGYLARYAQRYTKSPVHIIPNGVNIASLAALSRERAQATILTVSRLVEKNNVANLIRSLVYVRESVSDARLIIVGAGSLLANLRALAADLRIAGCVEFVGSIPHDELGVFLASATVFARPSLSEGLGSVFLEAMAAHVPVVASAVGGIPDIVRDGHTGTLCNPHDPTDIARAVTTLLIDPELRARFARDAYQFVQEYDWSNIAGKMAAVYQEVQSINA